MAFDLSNIFDKDMVMPEMQQGRPVKDLFCLKGRVALVTGGTGNGYGSQAVAALAEAGATVFITSRDQLRAQQTAAILRDKGLDVRGLALDLESEPSIAQVVETLVGETGRIDILVNNACSNHFESFETISLQDWNQVLAVNMTGTMLISRATAPHMLKNDGGVMVNLSSIYGVVAPDQRIYGESGTNSPLVYGMTKAALIQMTRYLATFWAPRIRVNCLTPGGLFNHQDEQFIGQYVAKTPLGRMAGADDLKGAILFLASDASAWVTGQNLVVDGGWTAW
jgi:NAD(P)-dependent dehydrogenase (short-subunit alcohol dehydrogenase family)